MKLYRPVGLRELELIAEAEYRAFPPRLPSQPIFYPVLNRAYARQIARDWNTKDAASGYVGFVTEFDVDDEYVGRYETQVVGASGHQELWVPAEELDDFNAHLSGRIRVTEHFCGEICTVEFEDDGHIPTHIPQQVVDLQIEEPLVSLINSCMTECLVECCGVEAFNRLPENILPWIRREGAEKAEAARRQAQDLSVKFNRAPVRVFSETLNLFWDAWYLSFYLFEWGVNIEAAIQLHRNE